MHINIFCVKHNKKTHSVKNFQSNWNLIKNYYWEIEIDLNNKKIFMKKEVKIRQIGPPSISSILSLL